MARSTRQATARSSLSPGTLQLPLEEHLSSKEEHDCHVVQISAPLVSESLHSFLHARKTPANADLVERWSIDMEVQLNVIAADGEPVAGRKSTWSNGSDTWHSIRIPRNAATAPIWEDYRIGYPLEEIAAAARDYRPTTPKPGKKNWLEKLSKRQKIGIGVAVGLAFVLVFFGVIFKLRTKDGTLVVEVSDPGVTVQVLNDEGKVQIERKGEKGTLTIAVDPGKHRLRVQKDGVEMFAKDVSIAAGGTETIKASWEPAATDRVVAPEPPQAVAPFDEKTAKEHQAAWAKYLGVPVEITNSIGMKLVLIPPGEFTMGGGGDAHKVKITKPFYLGKYVLTQEEWEAVLGKDKTPSQFQGPKNPVERVSWDDCQLFLKKLSERCGLAEGTYRLPTEAQWEYACRAGSTSTWCYGGAEVELGDYAWYGGNSAGKTHPVGQKKPNAWGLYDMHGNVWEWCEDWLDENYYKVSPASDPLGPSSGPRRVYRGGSWSDDAGQCGSAAHGSNELGTQGRNVGFRVSLVLTDKTVAQVTPDRKWQLPAGTI